MSVRQILEPVKNLNAGKTVIFCIGNRLKGDDVFCLTGTDEHGAKISKAAKAAAKEPKEFVDEISGEFRKLLKELNSAV